MMLLAEQLHALVRQIQELNRRLLVWHPKIRPARDWPPSRAADTAAANWVRGLLERKPARLVTVAMANETARIVWVVLARGETYRPVAAI